MGGGVGLGFPGNESGNFTKFYTPSAWYFIQNNMDDSGDEMTPPRRGFEWCLLAQIWWVVLNVPFLVMFHPELVQLAALLLTHLGIMCVVNFIFGISFCITGY